MHQKNRKLFVLYSIPIWFRKRINNFSKSCLCNKEKLYLVSYSIPLSSLVVLLLTGIFAINPSSSLKTSAVTIRDEWVVEKSDFSPEDSVDSGVYEQPAEGDHNAMLLSESDTENNPPTDDATAGITFSIGGADKDATIDATPGVVAYREHTVTVNISNADEYTLLISGNSEITADGNSAAKLVGITSATTGSDIAAGEWGYGWDYTGSKTKEEMTYQAVPSAQTEILTPKVDVNTNAASFVGKLNFAGKFPEGAAADNYTGGTARLTLVVSPKGNTGGAVWKKADGSDSNYYSGINTMQEIDTVTRDGGFCKNNPIVQTGWTIELQDNRGPNPVESYKIVKLPDGNCWMQENLRLPGGTKLTPSDSNVKSDWTLLASSSNSWSTNDQAIQMKNGAPGMAVDSGNTGDGEGWQSNYGNYYSWCAATAESCKLNRTGSSITSGQAEESICPKNWHLPTGDTNGNFYNLFGANGSNLGNDSLTRFSTIKASPYSFPAAGYVYSSAQLHKPGEYGRYWSSTPNSSVSNAYGLDFRNSTFSPGAYSDRRCVGYTIRCIASY